MDGLFFVLLAFFLFIAEAHIASFGILGFMGMVALFFGGNIIVEAGGLFGIPIGWGSFLGIATAVTLIGLFSSVAIARALKKNPIAGIEGMMNQDAVIVDWAEKSGTIRIQGEFWSARSEHPHSFTAGDIVTVSGWDDMILHIRVKD